MMSLDFYDKNDWLYDKDLGKPVQVKDIIDQTLIYEEGKEIHYHYATYRNVAPLKLKEEMLDNNAEILRLFINNPFYWKLFGMPVSSFQRFLRERGHKKLADDLKL